nr:helix-turn-helix domain-containing protein [Mycolicibacterium sp. BK634]
MSALAGFIRAARARVGLTQPELANRVYHSLSWLRRIERGDGAALTNADVRNFAEVLHLQPWEVQYLHLMLGTSPETTRPMDDSAMVSYVDALNPHPAVWLSIDGDSHANDAFRSLLPHITGADFVGAWFFSPAAKNVVVNWDQVADWWISEAKFRIAYDNHDHFFSNLVDDLIKVLPEFAERWNANQIPGNPEPPVWIIRRPDGVTVRVCMRVWWQSHRNGLLIQGVVQQ